MQLRNFTFKRTHVLGLLTKSLRMTGKSFLFISIGGIEAKDLGNYGQVFEISEKNLLDQILEKLQKAESNGVLGNIQKDIQEKMTSRLLGSFEKDDAPRADRYRSWTHNPSVTVSADLMDHKGVVFAQKGDRVNPLDRVAFGESMIFINGEDPQQIEWAQAQTGKIILVKGQPIKLEEEIGRPMYFDQQATLRKKFDLKAYPARVSQQHERDKVLLVEEIDDLRKSLNVSSAVVTPSETKNEELVDINKYEEEEADEISSDSNTETSQGNSQS